MPTGYTAQIEKGIIFKEFVMNCSRAMGALIEMRDEPSDAEIPEKFEPSDYHTKNLQKASDRYNYLMSLTIKKAGEISHKEYLKEISEREKSTRENNELIKKYKDMRSTVKCWIVPTTEHEGLKSFMIEQLDSSINFDSHSDFYSDHPVVLKTGEEWLTDNINKSVRDIKYHTKHQSEEQKRVDSRNIWIKQLRDSLK